MILLFKNKFPVTNLSSVAAFLLFTLLASATILPTISVNAFETKTTGFVNSLIAKTVGHLGDPIHQDITHSALDGFMKSPVIDDINHGHEDSDFVKDNQFNSAFHFDACDFDGATTHINDLYDKILTEITPSNKVNIVARLAARIDFGSVL